MNVAIRVDAAQHIGIGHIMRCLTLANALHERGASVQFIGMIDDQSILQRIHSDGHRLSELPAVTQDIQLHPDASHKPAHAGWLGKSWQDDLSQTLAVLDTEHVDWLIVDHYALDARWESGARAFCDNIMVIDDLADRQHDCDLLLDQTLDRKAISYRQLLPKECIVLTGAEYIMLRPQFALWREKSLSRRQNCKLEHLLITMGGVDKDNITAKVLEVISLGALPLSCKISVVVNANSAFLADIQSQVATLPWSVDVLVNVSNMAELMANSDLCIGTAGMTSWERCCLGLPTLLFVVADNQRDTAQILKEYGAVTLLDNVSDIGEFIDEFIISKDIMYSMSQAASRVTDGTGLKNVISSLELTYA